jgi:6-phosphogluconolactonase/glucosamine-6-phosphate isomerase/deaminase
LDSIQLLPVSQNIIFCDSGKGKSKIYIKIIAKNSKTNLPICFVQTEKIFSLYTKCFQNAQQLEVMVLAKTEIG